MLVGFTPRCHRRTELSRQLLERFLQRRDQRAVLRRAPEIVEPRPAVQRVRERPEERVVVLEAGCVFVVRREVVAVVAHTPGDLERRRIQDGERLPQNDLDPPIEYHQAGSVVRPVLV